jgi:hypothetical protein
MSAPAAHTSPSKPVNCYFEAVAAHDSEALADCFADDGVVLDVGRTVSGRDAIKMWAEREVLGGSYNIIDIGERDSIVSVLLIFTPQDEEAFYARYEFEIKNHKIAYSNLHYA